MATETLSGFNTLKNMHTSGIHGDKRRLVRWVQHEITVADELKSAIKGIKNSNTAQTTLDLLETLHKDKEKVTDEVLSYEAQQELLRRMIISLQWLEDNKCEYDLQPEDENSRSVNSSQARLNA